MIAPEQRTRAGGPTPRGTSQFIVIAVMDATTAQSDDLVLCGGCRETVLFDSTASAAAAAAAAAAGVEGEGRMYWVKPCNDAVCGLCADAVKLCEDPVCPVCKVPCEGWSEGRPGPEFLANPEVAAMVGTPDQVRRTYKLIDWRLRSLTALPEYSKLVKQQLVDFTAELDASTEPENIANKDKMMAEAREVTHSRLKDAENAESACAVWLNMARAAIKAAGVHPPTEEEMAVPDEDLDGQLPIGEFPPYVEPPPEIIIEGDMAYTMTEEQYQESLLNDPKDWIPKEPIEPGPGNGDPEPEDGEEDDEEDDDEEDDDDDDDDEEVAVAAPAAAAGGAGAAAPEDVDV